MHRIVKFVSRSIIESGDEVTCASSTKNRLHQKDQSHRHVNLSRIAWIFAPRAFTSSCRYLVECIREISPSISIKRRFNVALCTARKSCNLLVSVFLRCSCSQLWKLTSLKNRDCCMVRMSWHENFSFFIRNGDSVRVHIIVVAKIFIKLIDSGIWSLKKNNNFVLY